MPLLLAGVEYLLPIYKEANTYPHLIDTVIKGNPDLLSADELHKSAWEIIRPLFQAAQEEAFAHYQQLAGQEANELRTHWKRSFQPLIMDRLKHCSSPLESSNGDPQSSYK